MKLHSHLDPGARDRERGNGHRAPGIDPAVTVMVVPGPGGQPRFEPRFAQPDGGRAPLSAAERAPQDLVLSLDQVSRTYGSVVALHPLTLRLAGGAVGLVTGHNGAGKTTLLRLAAGLVAPTSGTDSAAFPAVYFRPGHGARRAQTVRQAVAFAAALREGIPSADSVLATTGLSELAGARVGDLSAGQRSRVTLAVALACAPRLVCLDEPTIHLDDYGQEIALRVIRRLAVAGAGVLIAGPSCGGLEPVADICIRLSHGRVEYTS